MEKGRSRALTRGRTVCNGTPRMGYVGGARLEAKYRMRRGSVPQTYVQLKKKIGNVMTNK